MASRGSQLDYGTLKTVHQVAVTLSIAGFLVRGIASLMNASWVRTRSARTWPHLVDSVLLVSALMLAWMLRLDPRAAPWLTAKILALLLYIALGYVALRPGRPRPVRAVAWLAALVTFGYIVSVALSKNPAGFFAGLL